MFLSHQLILTNTYTESDTSEYLNDNDRKSLLLLDEKGDLIDLEGQYIKVDHRKTKKARLKHKRALEKIKKNEANKSKSLDEMKNDEDNNQKKPKLRLDHVC